MGNGNKDDLMDGKKAPKKEKNPLRYLAAGKAKKENGAEKIPASENPITRQTNIMDLVHNYPEAVPVLIEAGLHCIGCQLSVFDTLEAGCALHGMDEETVGKLIAEMNERVKGFRK